MFQLRFEGSMLYIERMKMKLFALVIVDISAGVAAAGSSVASFAV
jgi:hypothetical protein